MKRVLIAVVLGLCFAVACDQMPGLGNGSGLNTNQDQSLVVDAGAATETVKFVTTGPWNATSSEEWISASPASGNAGSHEILLEIEANPTDKSRTATVTISVTEGVAAEIKFTVTQKAGNGNGNTEGEKPDEGDKPGEGGEDNPGEGEKPDEGENPGEEGDDQGHGKGEDFGGNFD